MTVPPFAVAFVSKSKFPTHILTSLIFVPASLVFAYVSDRFRCRGFVSMFSSLLCVIGFAMFLGSTKHNIQYGSLFLSITGTYIAAPTLSTWSANNAAPHARRATAIAIGFIMTNSGGILATWLLGSLSVGPKYTLATRVLLAFSVCMVAVSGMNTYYLWDQNKRKAEIRSKINRDQEKPGLGDKSAWFEYAL